jgi:DNA-directed RNA polymerase specialized sigma24 family protein
VEFYEVRVARGVRQRLSHSGLRRWLDPLDVEQTVLADFFALLSTGKVSVASDEQLSGLLFTMARNAVTSELRKRWRELRRRRAGAMDGLADPAPGPGTVVSRRDACEAVRRCLSAEERLLADRRGADHSWAAIAAEVGDTPEALRKKLTRALRRARVQLRWDGN